MAEEPTQRSPVEQPVLPELVPLHPSGSRDVMAVVPRPLTSFVGRKREVAEIQVLLEDRQIRLLTLTGPGGVGKTRLALQTAARTGARFDDVWLVALAPVRDPALVASTISRALGFPQDMDQTLDQGLALLVRDRSALLLLDNFEQVLAAGPLLSQLLMACPSLTILVTSRAPLRISGEHIYPVPPLAMPDGDHPASPEMLRNTDAIRLFIERAAEQAPAFTLTVHNARAVVEICRELDGLPLAIELAAARVSAFSPATLRERLHARLPLLVHGPHDQPTRLRSMRASIAWSHDLLDPKEKMLLAQLAVFAGGWTLDAAEAVATPAGNRPVLEMLASLVAMNLVRAEPQADGSMRYGMLETIREFAREQLERSGEERAVQDRHAMYFLALAERTDWGWFMPLAEGEACLARLEAERANIRAALDWFGLIGDDASMLRMAGKLGGLWVVCGHLDEGQAWLESSLAAGQEVDATIRARAMGTLSWISSMQGRSLMAFDLAEQGLALFRSEQHPIGTIYCLTLSGMAARHLGDFGHAYERPREALSLLAALDGPVWTRNMIITLHAALGHTALLQGDIARAEMHYQQALDFQIAKGHAPGGSHIYGNHVLAGLGDIARATGRHEDAIPHYRTSLELAWRNHDARAVVYAIGGLAGALAMLGRHGDAAGLFGASEALHTSYGYRFDLETLDRQRALGLPEPWMRAEASFGHWQALRDSLALRGVPPIPPVVDLDAAEAAWAEGGRMPLPSVVEMALAARVRPDVSSDDTPAPLPYGLTAREMEVLRRLVEGESDNAIADALFISRRTVATHVRHVYDKLGVSSRAQATAVAIRNGLA